MLVWDNQQATRVGWFTAILEGEGYFRAKANGLGAQVSLTNTDLSIIEGCESFLRANRVWFTRTESYGNGRSVYVLWVRNSSRDILQYATILYDLIEQSLECRRDEYQTILGASTTTRDPSVDLNWLAGIYEAEGSFSLTLDHRDHAALAISISNTNARIIDKVKLNLNTLGCGFHVRDKVKVKPHHKAAQIVAVTGILRCHTFFGQMVDRWTGSRHSRMAAAILEFAKSRLSRSRKDPYNPRELSLIQSVCDLNGR